MRSDFDTRLGGILLELHATVAMATYPVCSSTSATPLSDDAALRQSA